MGIRDRPTSPRSPWQNGYAERLIGSIRRECLDHVVVFGERHLRHVLLSYLKYYNEVRTHLSLEKDAPVSRAVERGRKHSLSPSSRRATLPICSDLIYDRHRARERFNHHGIIYEAARKPKSDLYRDLLPAINSRRVDLLEDARLIAQIVGLERRTARGGKDSIDHAPNAHDDLANSMAGVVAALTSSAHGYDSSMQWIGQRRTPVVRKCEEMTKADDDRWAKADISPKGRHLRF